MNELEIYPLSIIVNLLFTQFYNYENKTTA